MLKDFGEQVFKLKYALGDESWEQACSRVAWHIANIENTEEKKVEWMSKFYQIISEGVFIPGGRILANAGTEIKNLMNCFVLPIEDSRESIYKTLGNAAEVFAWGGGVGYNFSHLREEGAQIESTGGTSSGPLSFMELFDQTGEVIKQASRRGAQMGMMHISHPDIVKFIKHKATLNKRNNRIMQELKNKAGYTSGHKNLTELGYKDESYNISDTVDKVEGTLLENQLSHFNISVIIPDSFMEAVKNGDDWELVSPQTGEVVEVVSATHLLHLIARNAWESGDPGVFFIDKAEEDNMTPYIGEIEATNPCGEVPLIPYESCCLGSLNLSKFYDVRRDDVNWEFLEYAVRTAVRFLDNVQEVSVAPVESINTISKGLRKLGLGVMGWADLLVMLNIPYDSEKAYELARRLSWFISYMAWSESMVLAEERGTFPFFNFKEVNQHVVTKVLKGDESILERFENLDEEVFEVRNNSVTSIAPTGSIALLADVNSSIEPFYSLAYKRNITEGVGNEATATLVIFNELFKERLDELNLSEDEISQTEKSVLSSGSVQDLDFLPQNFKDLFKTAHEISWESHIKTQQAWQEYTTNAVSKTINMPNEAIVAEVYEAIIEMWKSNLKGGTIYRDGSKSFQILESPKT
jgi:ribonucleoside-diphosphate reductase alpha chain